MLPWSTSSPEKPPFFHAFFRIAAKGPIRICQWKTVTGGYIVLSDAEIFWRIYRTKLINFLWMLEKQSIFTSWKIHQHSEYLSDYFVLSSLTSRVVFYLAQMFWHSLLGSFTSSFVLVGQLQKRMPLSVIIVVCYFVFLEDGGEILPGLRHSAQVPSWEWDSKCRSGCNRWALVLSVFPHAKRRNQYSISENGKGISLFQSFKLCIPFVFFKSSREMMHKRWAFQHLLFPSCVMQSCPPLSPATVLGDCVSENLWY